MDNFKISILEYLGKVENGILLLISIVYQKKYYEATFFYSEKDILLTISDDLELTLGHKIQDDKNYVSILKDILSKIVPYHEMIDRIDNVDFSRWVKGIIKTENENTAKLLGIVITDNNQNNKKKD